MNRSMLNPDGSHNFGKLIEQLGPHIDNYGPVVGNVLAIYSQFYIQNLASMDSQTAKQQAFTQVWGLVQDFSNALTARNEAELRAA